MTILSDASRGLKLSSQPTSPKRGPVTRGLKNAQFYKFGSLCRLGSVSSEIGSPATIRAWNFRCTVVYMEDHGRILSTANAVKG